VKAAHALRRLYAALMGAISNFAARRLRHNFYLLLAVLFSIVLAIDALFLRAIVDLRHRGYDIVVKSRVLVPSADPDIVIVDINEASLSAMAREYGRWPWPRQVFGEFVEQVQAQKPKAIVFDILFSDPDLLNPDSDAAFDEIIAGAERVYFPMLRLPAEDDARSELRPSMIPGLSAVPGQTPVDAPIAMVMPFFRAAFERGRLGLHNIVPDADGIARAYQVRQDVRGWRLPSLPARVAQDLGAALPDRDEILLNWRGRPFTYHYVGFSEVYLDGLNRERTRPTDEFAGKIVLIGSTAPSLFDIKATSVDRQFPGVEILATAIDNLLRGDPIRVPGSRWPAVLVALGLLWATALGFYRQIEPELFAKVFGFSQVGLLAISYLTINLTAFYVNLAGPVLFAFAYFSVAKIYAYASAKALESNLVTQTLHGHGRVVATMAVLEFQARDALAVASLLRGLKKALDKAAHDHPRDVEILRGSQRGVWGVMEPLLVVSWVHEVGDDASCAVVERELAALLASIPDLVDTERIGDESLRARGVARQVLGDAGRAPTAAQWRLLFAKALQSLEAPR
jgi:adenylate cyclase